MFRRKIRRPSHLPGPERDSDRKGHTLQRVYLFFRDRFCRRNEATTTTDIFVRRSARLSGGAEPQHFSPRPDPDEVYVAFSYVLCIG